MHLSYVHWTILLLLLNTDCDKSQCYAPHRLRRGTFSLSSFSFVLSFCFLVPSLVDLFEIHRSDVCVLLFSVLCPRCLFGLCPQRLRGEHNTQYPRLQGKTFIHIGATEIDCRTSREYLDALSESQLYQQSKSSPPPPASLSLFSMYYEYFIDEE